MIPLILEISDTDGYSYSATRTLPFEFESKEALASEIFIKATRYMETEAAQQAAIEATMKDLPEGKDTFTFDLPQPQQDELIEQHGRIYEEYEPKLAACSEIVSGQYKLSIRLFINFAVNGDEFSAPTIYTVDEWFESYKVKDNE
jgi:hypothetical protein